MKLHFVFLALSLSLVHTAAALEGQNLALSHRSEPSDQGNDESSSMMSGFQDAMDDAMSAIQDAMGSAGTAGDDAGEEATSGMQQAAQEIANAQDIASQFFGEKVSSEDNDGGSKEEKRQAGRSDDAQTAQKEATQDIKVGLHGGMLDLSTAQRTVDQYLGSNNKRQSAPTPGGSAPQSPFSGFKGFFDQLFGPKGQQPTAAGNTQGSPDQCTKDSEKCGGDGDKTEAQADKPEPDDEPKDDKSDADTKTKDDKAEAESKPKDGKVEAESKTKDDKAESKNTKGDDAKQDEKPTPESQDSKSAKGAATSAQDETSAGDNAASLSRRGVHFNKQKHQAAFNIARDLPEKRRVRPSGKYAHGSSRTTYYNTKSANAFLSSAEAMETQQAKDGQKWLNGITGKYGREVVEEHQASEVHDANEDGAQIEKRRDQDADSYKEMSSSGAFSCWDDTIARILAALVPVVTIVLAGLF